MHCWLGPALGGQLINYFSKNPLKPPSEPCAPASSQVTKSIFHGQKWRYSKHCNYGARVFSMVRNGDILSTVVTVLEDAPKPG